MKCLGCGTDNFDTNRYCVRCGKALSAQAVTPDQAPGTAQLPSTTSGQGGALTDQPSAYRAPAPIPPHLFAPGSPPITPPDATLSGWRGPFASRGPRVQRASYVYVGRANSEGALMAWMLEALRPFRAYQEYVDGKALRLERRPYVTATKEAATIAVYTTSVRDDLYASWSVFSRQDVDLLRVAGLFLLALTFSIPGGIKIDLFRGMSVQWDFQSYLGSVVIWVILLGILLFWAGLTFRRDFLGFLRAPLNEFQLEDVHSLRVATERSLQGWNDGHAVAL